jgi:DNA polymerase III subunit epsilon
MPPLQTLPVWFLTTRFSTSVSCLGASNHHGFGHARSLASLITDAGHFMRDAHRAGPDSWALTCLLAMTAADGRAYAAHLIDAARRTSTRVYAQGAPFNLRTNLKAVGYRWNAERKVWWIEGDPETIDNEAVWLRSLHPTSRPVIEPIDWFNRHAG